MPSLTLKGGDPRGIEKRTLKNGRRAYRVRWRDAGRGSREHVRSFDRHEDAVRFETDMRRRKQLGELGELETGRQTLDEWAREWFRTYARPNLAGHTLVYYARTWDKHVLSRLGEYELRRITPAVIAEFADELRRDDVGDPTVRRCSRWCRESSGERSCSAASGRIRSWRFASPSRVAVVRSDRCRRRRSSSCGG